MVSTRRERRSGASRASGEGPVPRVGGPRSCTRKHPGEELQGRLAGELREIAGKMRLVGVAGAIDMGVVALLARILHAPPRWSGSWWHRACLVPPRPGRHRHRTHRCLSRGRRKPWSARRSAWSCHDRHDRWCRHSHAACRGYTSPSSWDLTFSVFWLSAGVARPHGNRESRTGTRGRYARAGRSKIDRDV